jgi:hypothetical protein
MSLSSAVHARARAVPVNKLRRDRSGLYRRRKGRKKERMREVEGHGHPLESSTELRFTWDGRIPPFLHEGVNAARQRANRAGTRACPPIMRRWSEPSRAGWPSGWLGKRGAHVHQPPTDGTGCSGRMDGCWLGKRCAHVGAVHSPSLAGVGAPNSDPGRVRDSRSLEKNLVRTGRKTFPCELVLDV